MIGPRPHFELRLGALAGMAGLLALSAFVGYQAPSQQSLLTAPPPWQKGDMQNSQSALAGGIALIAAQAMPASYERSSKPEYRLTDLGTLAGASYATAINNQGRVVGSCQTPQGDIAFLWKHGHLRRLGAFSAYDINDHGQIVGFKETHSGIEQPLLKVGARTTLLATLPGAASAYGYRINNRGQVVENALGGPRMLSRAFVWSSRRAWPLWTLPGFASCQAEAINRSGAVAGAATASDGEQHACLWRHGRMIDLGSLAGGRGSLALGINEHDDVVGSSGTASGSAKEPVRHAFLWRHGQMLDLGTVGAWPQSSAAAINDYAQVVGSIERATASGSGDEGHAFLWQRGRMRDLNEMIRPHSGWVLTEAVDINDRGQIVGNGIYKGCRRPFLLTPRRSSLAWSLIARGTPEKTPRENIRPVVVAAMPQTDTIVTRAVRRRPEVALVPGFPHRRRRTVVERVGAYRATLPEPNSYRAKFAARVTLWPQTRRYSSIPIGYEGIVVARSSRPYTYQVMDGNLSRDIYLGPGKVVRTGEEIRVRGVLQRNGVVAAASVARLGYYRHAIRVQSALIRP